MPERGIPITLVVRTLDDDSLVAEPLLFSEVACCDRKIERLRVTVRDLAKHIAERAPNFTLHQRSMPGDATVETVHITLAPPKKKLDWEEPVELGFHVVRWRHGVEAYLAFVPALGIEVIAAREPELNRMVPEHIIAALRRSKAAESLYELALAQRTQKASLQTLSMTAAIKSPRQIEQDQGKEQAKKPAIEEVGIVLNDIPLKPAYAMEAVIRQIADALGGRNARSVLLIGPSGVGKTAAVHELVRCRSELHLDESPFWATSGSRLIAGMSGFGMWQKRCQRLCREASRDRAILHLGNLVELMEVGQGGAGGQGIAGFLRPYLARGEILAIAECTPEQLPLIERQDPHLLEVFHQVRVEEPSAESSTRILQQHAQASGRPSSFFLPGWLDALDRLHRRYATYSAYPGRPLRFLDNLIKDRPENEPLGTAEVIAAFSRETGLPQFMLDSDAPLDLAAARQWFAQRVIGQERAVDLVTDLLATVKAALTRPRRPIASLLFIGPTGVGKTELAKALAEYFFGDRNRLTRFDMSEFASAMAVERLVGGTFGAEGVLTAKVREQPFSVILFDEFEKAHWGFFDLLLQVLGEGRLTDAAGRLGDFSNAIVVMTSNLGAEAFGRGTFGLGKGAGYPDAERHFTDEVRAFLRPELFNRIDRVVPFLPLQVQTIAKIAEREISLAVQRDGFKLRGPALDVTPAAMEHLTAKGYDVRYGARPLKRAIERELLAPLAESVNDYPADLKLVASANATAGRLNVEVRAYVDPSGKNATPSSSESDLAALAKSCCTFRRDVQKLQRCSSLLALQNQLFLLERDVRRKAARKKPDFDPHRADMTKQIRAITDPAAQLSATINQLEDDILCALYGNEEADLLALQVRLAPLPEQLNELLLALLARQSSSPHSVTVAIYGDRLRMWELARAYYSVARAVSYTTKIAWFSRHGPRELRRHSVDSVVDFLADPNDKTIGVAIGFSGRYASLRFSAEMGIHQFNEANKETLCRVDTSDEPIADYEPPEGVEFHDDPTGKAQREYHMEAGFAVDSLLKQRLSWGGRTIDSVVAQAINLHLRQLMWGILTP